MTERSAAHKKEVERVLGSTYGLGNITWGARLGGFSSINVALTAGQNSFVLKKYGPHALAQLDRLEQLATSLHRSGFPAPLPRQTAKGSYHFVCLGETYALFPRNSGRVRHGPELSSLAIQSVAVTLAKLHELGPVNKVHLGGPRRPLLKDSAELPTPEQVCDESPRRRLDPEALGILKSSIETKRLVIAETSTAELTDLHGGRDFVHGDFHNENILFDPNGHLTCVMDFEESYAGQGICDVVQFALSACCPGGLNAEGTAAARAFLGHYRLHRPQHKFPLRAAVRRYFLAMASSTFLEARLVAGEISFGALLRRDIGKMGLWLKNPNSWTNALGEATR